MLSVAVAVSAGQAQRALVSTGSPKPVPHWSCWLLQSLFPPSRLLQAFLSSPSPRLWSVFPQLPPAPASPPHTGTAHQSPTTVRIRGLVPLPPSQVPPLTSPSTLRAPFLIFYLFFLRAPASPDEPCPAPLGVTTATGISQHGCSSAPAPSQAGFSHHISPGHGGAYVELGLSSGDLTQFCGVTRPINQHVSNCRQTGQGVGSALCNV